MKFTVDNDLHEICVGRCSGEEYNATTILKDGAGQYVGYIAEYTFARFCLIHSLPFDMVGDEILDYDFDILGLRFDVKAKKRSVPAQGHYNAHVADSQKHLKTHYYVFASVLFGGGKAVECDLIGYIPKKDFWDIAEPMPSGTGDNDHFTAQASGHVIQYKKLRSMEELALNLLDLKWSK